MTSEKPLRSSALWYALNAQEYELLHHYLSRRRRRDSERSLKAEADHKPATVHDEYRAAAIRSSLRVFIGTAAGLKAWEFISKSLLSRGAAHK